MSEQLSPEQDVWAVLREFVTAAGKLHSAAEKVREELARMDDQDAAIRAAVVAERARWVKAATDVARDATAAGNEHAAAGALAVSMLTPTTEATHG